MVEEMDTLLGLVVMEILLGFQIPTGRNKKRKNVPLPDKPTVIRKPISCGDKFSRLDLNSHLCTQAFIFPELRFLSAEQAV